jgi:phosphate-selective porin
VTCRFILFDDALVGHTVNDRDRTVVRFLRRAVFASAYSSENLLHFGTNERAKACIMSALLVVLFCSFTSLW